MGVILKDEFSMNVFSMFFFENVNLGSNFEQFPSVDQSVT